jgi:hypothetical protein
MWSNTCRREVEIEITEANGMFLCECGAEMKKVYSAPILTRLSEAEAVERFDEFLPGRRKLGRAAH